MKFEIETYKGQTIEYDDDYDKFICTISIEDKWKDTKRLSLKDVRSEIDKFIKLNVDFKPFKCLSLDIYDKDFKVINVSAIRTDGKFINHPEGNENYKSHANKKDIAKWYIYDAEIVKEKKALYEEKEAAIDKYRNGIADLCKKLKPLDLSKYEHILNPE